jgi:hypothetical protein
VIASILTRAVPDDGRMMLAGPKRVDLAVCERMRWAITRGLSCRPRSRPGGFAAGRVTRAWVAGRGCG